MAPLLWLASRTCLFALPLLLAPPSSAGPKFDLSPYLGNVGQEGDFKVFMRSTGGQRTVTLLELEPWKKGWRGVFESTVSGAGEDFDGTTNYEGYLVPGKQLLAGSTFFDTGLVFFSRKPAKDLKLLVNPGKAQRINQRALAVFDGIKAGRVERRGTWSMDGFETVETPSGTYEQALRAAAFSSTRLRMIRGAVGCANDVCGNKLIQQAQQTLWYAEGVGLVRADTHTEVFVDGALVEDATWTEELASGRIDSVPFP